MPFTTLQLYLIVNMIFELTREKQLNRLIMCTYLSLFNSLSGHKFAEFVRVCSNGLNVVLGGQFIYRNLNKYSKFQLSG